MQNTGARIHPDGREISCGSIQSIQSGENLHDGVFSSQRLAHLAWNALGDETAEFAMTHVIDAKDRSREFIADG